MNSALDLGARPVLELLPADAPFSPIQRAWLNGFFAGLLTRLAERSGQVPPSPSSSRSKCCSRRKPAQPKTGQETDQGAKGRGYTTR